MIRIPLERTAEYNYFKTKKKNIDIKNIILIIEQFR